MAIGQERGTSSTYIELGFLEFATGVLDGLTVSSGTVSLVPSSTTYNVVAHTVRLYKRDWGGTIETTDWVNPTTLSSGDLMATRSTSGVAAGTRYDFTSESSFASNINTTGPTRLVGTNNNAVDGTQPPDSSSDEAVYWYRSDNTGTTNDPKLTVVATDVSSPTVISVGTEANGTNATVTPTLPADVADNDILICFVAYRSGTPDLTQSYTKKATHTNGYANLDVWWKRASGAQTAPAVSGCTESVIAQLVSVRGAITSGDPFEAYSSTAATGTDTTQEAPSLTTTSANALVIGAISTADDNGHNITSSGNMDSIAMLSYTQNTSGTDNSLCVWSGRRATAGAIGSVVVTQVVNGADAWTHVVGAITPASTGVTGTAESTLQAPTCAASGSEEFTGTAAPTITGTVHCEGSQLEPNVFASGDIAVAPVTCAATGVLWFSGACESSVAGPICAASGTYTPQTITGTCSSTMKRANCVAVGFNHLLKTANRPSHIVGIIETDHTQNIPKMKVGVIECQ